jgi:hypothetical protein
MRVVESCNSALDAVWWLWMVDVLLDPSENSQGNIYKALRLFIKKAYNLRLTQYWILKITWIVNRTNENSLTQNWLTFCFFTSEICVF